MRLIVMSDSHGDEQRVRSVVSRHAGEEAVFLHLGDGLREFCRVMEEHPALAYDCVVGNHEDDAFQRTQYESRLLHLGGRSIWLVHGDRQNVKLDLLELEYMGRRAGADLVLYGHTHVSADTERNGVRMLNPGALLWARDCTASYAVLDVENGQVCARIVPMDGCQ